MIALLFRTVSQSALLRNEKKQTEERSVCFYLFPSAPENVPGALYRAELRASVVGAYVDEGAGPLGHPLAAGQAERKSFKESEHAA